MVDRWQCAGCDYDCCLECAMEKEDLGLPPPVPTMGRQSSMGRDKVGVAQNKPLQNNTNRKLFKNICFTWCICHLCVCMYVCMQVFVFLDEINTSAHIGLITEIITQHSLNGTPLDQRIMVLAALNPYRMRPKMRVHGIVKENSAAALVAAEEMEPVYKVHPIPEKLLCYIYDFGSLQEGTEQLYIESMISRQFSDAIGGKPFPAGEVNGFCRLIQACQTFLRATEGDASVVSVRPTHVYMFMFVGLYVCMLVRLHV